MKIRIGVGAGSGSSTMESMAELVTGLDELGFDSLWLSEVLTGPGLDPVVGLGWAVLPENGTSVNGLPRVERSLDWIRLAARFPVRIRIEDPDESFRIGASAVATVHGSLTRVSQ